MARLNGVQWALLGRMWSMGDAFNFTVAPPLAVLDEKMGREAVTEMHAYINDVDALAARDPRHQWLPIQAREVLGEYHLRRDDRDAAIATWQEILDKFPTSQQFERFEKLIKEHTGLARSNN